VALQVFACYCITRFCITFIVPDQRHGGRGHGRNPGLHCLHQGSADEPPTLSCGRRETQNPQGAEEEIPWLQGQEEKTAKEGEIDCIHPSIIMGNVRSLVKKMDELISLTKSKSVFCVGSFMCYTDMAA